MSKIMLKNVRLSFPSIFNRAVFNGVEGKYEATFLIPKKNKELKKTLDNMIVDAISSSRVGKVPMEKRCLKDGDDSEYEGYPDNWSLKASNNNRFQIMDRTKVPVTQDDNLIYAGCYVNALIDFWVQNNDYGKRVNANLYGIQFVSDGEPFGIGTIDVSNDFDDMGDDDDEDLGV